MRLKPQHPSRGRRIDAGPLPPSGLIAAAVDRAMVSATQGHSEFIADLAPQSPALGKAQVAGARGLAAADQAGALSDRPDVRPVTDPAWLRQDQQALVDRPRPPKLREAASEGPQGRNAREPGRQSVRLPRD